jgi:methanogenic corrinoid protein MtbC1
MPAIIESIRAADAKVSILVGGAPLSADYAARIGADGYAQNASDAVTEAARLLASTA